MRKIFLVPLLLAAPVCAHADSITCVANKCVIIYGSEATAPEAPAPVLKELPKLEPLVQEPWCHPADSQAEQERNCWRA